MYIQADYGIHIKDTGSRVHVIWWSNSEYSIPAGFVVLRPDVGILPWNMYPLYTNQSSKELTANRVSI